MGTTQTQTVSQFAEIAVDDIEVGDEIRVEYEKVHGRGSWSIDVSIYRISHPAETVTEMLARKTDYDEFGLNRFAVTVCDGSVSVKHARKNAVTIGRKGTLLVELTLDEIAERVAASDPDVRAVPELTAANCFALEHPQGRFDADLIARANDMGFGVSWIQDCIAGFEARDD